MRVFVSSVITGFEPYREAAVRAIESLDYQAVTAEDFGARPDSPQQACLEAARTADVTVLLLGERYGYAQAPALSATHEEFHEARDHRSVIAFVQQDVRPEPAQQEFIREVQEWAGGAVTAEFSDPDDLHTKVVCALHGHALRQATGPADPAEMHQRAVGLLPASSHGGWTEPHLHVVVVGGPRQQVVRPAVLDAVTLGAKLHQQALFGPYKVLDSTQGASPVVHDTRLVVAQGDRGVEMHEDGSVLVSTPALGARPERSYAVRAVIEEDIRDKLLASIGFSAWALSEVDPVTRLSDVSVVAAVAGASSTEWRTRAQDAANPNSSTIGYGRPDPVVVPSAPLRHPRGALTAQSDALAADLLALLRRAFS